MEDKVISLTERLAMATATKTPGQAIKSAATATATNDVPKSMVSAAWNSDDDFDDVKSDIEKTEANKGEKVSEQEKKASAESTVALMDMSMSMLFIPILRGKLKKNFTAAEWKRVKDIQHADKSKMSADDLAFRQKVDSLMAKFREKRDAIELQPDEIRRNERAFYTYYDVTNTKMSPIIIAVSAVVTTLSGRVADVFFDD